MPSVFAYPKRLLKPFAKGGILALGSASPQMQHRLYRGRKNADLDALTRRIILPSLPIADEDLARLRHWGNGRTLARQGNWEALADQITLADDARLSTPGGADEATLLAQGAQSDALAAVTDALADGKRPHPGGIEALEDIAAEHAENHAIVLIVALAHLNMGRAWVSCSAEISHLPSEHHTHFKRAQQLLDPFDAEDLDSASLAATQAALAEILCPNVPCIHAAYDRLLRIDPENTNHLRAYGRGVMHGLADDPKLLTKLATTLQEQHDNPWGDEVYVWLHLDVLGQSDEALSALDTDRFSTALRALVASRQDQHLINQLAAFCAIDMAPRGKDDTRHLARKRAALNDNLDWLLSEHLAELHPMLWSGPTALPALAPRDNAPRALVAAGRKTALQVIARRFAHHMSDGSSIAFSPAGMYRLPSI